MRRLRVQAILLAGLLLLVGAGCDDVAHERVTSPLTMICEATFPPYEYHVAEGIDGIDPALASIIAHTLGRELVVQDMAFDAILPAVSSGKVDIAASGITITEERKRQVLFSSPYVEAAQVAVVTQQSPITDAAQLQGYRIGVQSGTTGDLYVSKAYGQPERFQNLSFAITAVSSGKVDVAVVDQKPAEVFVKTMPGMKILPRPVVLEAYAFAFAKKNTRLCAQVGLIIEAMQASGAMATLIARYEAAMARRKAGDKAALNHKIDVQDIAETVARDVALQQRLAALDESSAGKHGEQQTLREAWGDFREALYSNFIEAQRWKHLVKGFLTTIEISFFAILIGLVIGFAVAVVRVTHDTIGGLSVANWVCKCYLTVIRGTPVVVQLLIIYFVIFGSVNVSKIFVAVVAFGLNSGAYVSEIIRAGMMSIDKGQMEAGRALGLSYLRAIRFIILPQAFRNVLPALGNEFIVLLKETSVAGYIALMDLTKAGDIIRSQTYTAFLPLLAVAIVYLAMVSLFASLLGMLERRLKRHG